MGFRRKHNDRLLMFMLRHYGQDEGGRRTTVNYFSARASAGGGDGGHAVAAVGSATVRTVVAGHADAGGETRALRDDRLAGELDGFRGVALDAEAEAAVNAALEACAARARAADDALASGGEAAVDAAADDPAECYVRIAADGDPFLGALVPAAAVDDYTPFADGEPDWRQAGADDPQAAIEVAVASVTRARRRSNWPREPKPD